MPKKGKRKAPVATPEPVPTKKKLSALLVTAIVGIVSAIGLAVRNQATDVFKSYISPVVLDASCSLEEAVRGNTAADHFTVVVLPFANDPTNAAQSSIAEALASNYELNVVSSCRRIEITTAGNHDRNVEAARKRANSLLDKYDADMLIFGELRRDESGHATRDSRIIVTARPYIKFLYDNGVRYSDLFDGSNPDAYIRSSAFSGEIINDALFIGEESGCLGPLIGLCKILSPPLSELQLTNKLQRIRQIQTLYVNRELWRYSNSSTNFNFERLGYFASAIALELYINHRVTQIKGDDGKPQDLLEVADESVRLSDRFSTNPPDMDSEYRESSAAVARGVIFLLRGQSCSAPFYLEKANRWFEEAQPHLETLDEVGGDQAAGLLFLLALAQAKLALYATAKQDDLRALRDSFEAEAQRTLSAVSQYRGLVFIGAYLGDEYKEFRERLGKKIDDESAIIAAGLKERDQSRIRTLLHMKTCS